MMNSIDFFLLLGATAPSNPQGNDRAHGPPRPFFQLELLLVFCIFILKNPKFCRQVGNGSAFAALKADGSVVPWWGLAYFVDDSLSTPVQLSAGVETLVGNFGAFAAVKSDGSVG